MKAEFDNYDIGGYNKRLCGTKWSKVKGCDSISYGGNWKIFLWGNLKTSM